MFQWCSVIELLRRSFSDVNKKLLCYEERDSPRAGEKYFPVFWRGVALEASQGPGGNTDNYTGAKFKMYTSLIGGSYHLKNPPCIRLST